MAASKICINHDVATGVVNLLQVGGYVKGNNARRHVEASMKALKMPSRKDEKICGVGKDVLVGSYEEALKIAEHLGATQEQVEAVKGALRALTPAPVVADVSRVMGQSGGEKSTREELGGFSTHLMTEDSVRRMVLPVLGDTDPFPICYDKQWCAYMGYSRYDTAMDKIKTLIKDGDLIVDTDVQPREQVLLATGNKYTAYYFSVDGIKLFFMAACTPEARKFKMYFVKIEKEYNKVVPELLKTQEEVDRLKEENERLRREKEIASDYQRWRATREDGISAHDSAMERLKHIVSGINESGSAKLYAIVNDAMNKAVLDFKGSTTAFKAALKYDKGLSVPDVLDDLALREMQAIVERFTRYFAKEGHILRQLPLDVVIRKVYEFGDWQRMANVQAGDLKNDHMLSNEEAKKRKRKRQKDIKVKRLGGGRTSAPQIVHNHTNNYNNSPVITINNAPPRTTQQTLKSFFVPKE